MKLGRYDLLFIVENMKFSPGIWIPLRRLALQIVPAIAAFFAASLTLIAAPDEGLAYPDKPITIIVPAQPGGGTDTFAREIARLVGQRLGQPVIVENKDGAGGAFGISSLVAARPDGYTLAFTWNGPLTATPHSLTVPYTQENYRPLLSIGYSSYILCMRPNSGAPNAKAFAALLKERSGKLTYGHDGSGGTMQLAAERIFNRLGAQLRGIPFGGAGETAEALVGGQIDIYGGSVPPILPFLAAGKVQCPLLTSAGGNPAVPKAQGLSDLGIDAEETLLWWGLIAPANVPDDIIARLEAAFTAAVETASVIKLVDRNGASIRVLDGESTAKLIATEFAALAATSRMQAARRAR